MKVSIIGAGRSRNGIGEYIAKYFHKHGAKVTSVLGTTEKTSFQASLALQKYGVDAQPYTDFDQMVKTKQPDTVVIASPASTHYEYLLKCLDSGLHVFCEKPFIWNDHSDLPKMLEKVFEKAREKKITLAMNSQWPFSISDYEQCCGEIRIKEKNTFSIKMAPPTVGREMIPESVPHALSLLYCILGDGDIVDLEFKTNGEKEMSIRFTYLFGTKACDAFIQLAYQEIQPRDFSFGVNDRIVFRSLGLDDYDIYFRAGERMLRIVDPLELSVKNFIESVEKNTEPLIGMSHIHHNMILLKEIDDGYCEFRKRSEWKN